MGSAARRKFEFNPSEAAVYGEMDRLFTLGFNLIPLRGEDVILEDGTELDAKGPTVQFKDRRRLPLRVVWDLMAKHGSLMYGVRLQNLVVVDMDTETPEAVDYARRRFGDSSVQVRTKRGRHHWFRVGTCPVPMKVREEGIAIDIKAGQNSFVVGPMSVRSDGVVYEYDVGGLVRRTQLPAFTDRKPLASTGSGAVGERHYFLVSEAIEFARIHDSEADLIDEVMSMRNFKCEDPASISDDEVRKIAVWAWKKRLENNLWGGRNSVLKIRRTALDSLGLHEHGGDASLLYLVLQANHGHHAPGKTFAIVPGAMRKANLINMSEQRIRRARDVLIETGLLVETTRRRGYQQPNQYQLTRGPAPDQGKGGGGSVSLH